MSPARALGGLALALISGFAFVLVVGLASGSADPQPEQVVAGATTAAGAPPSPAPLPVRIQAVRDGSDQPLAGAPVEVRWKRADGQVQTVGGGLLSPSGDIQVSVSAPAAATELEACVQADETPDEKVPSPTCADVRPDGIVQLRVPAT